MPPFTITKPMLSIGTQKTSKQKLDENFINAKLTAKMLSDKTENELVRYALNCNNTTVNL